MGIEHVSQSCYKEYSSFRAGDKKLSYVIFKNRLNDMTCLNTITSKCYNHV